MAEKVERMVDTTVASADSLKVQTADALEEAARKLREADLSAKADDVKAILSDAESRISQMRADISQSVEPVQAFITEHPLASVMIAAGVGFMAGSLAGRMHGRE